MREYFFRVFVLSQHYVCNTQKWAFIVVLQKVFERIIADMCSPIHHGITSFLQNLLQPLRYVTYQATFWDTLLRFSLLARLLRYPQ
jgi:hypothetical protein